MTYHDLPHEWKVRYFRILRDNPNWSENQIFQMLKIEMRHVGVDLESMSRQSRYDSQAKQSPYGVDLDYIRRKFPNLTENQYSDLSKLSEKEINRYALFRSEGADHNSALLKVPLFGNIEKVVSNNGGNVNLSPGNQADIINGTIKTLRDKGIDNPSVMNWLGKALSKISYYVLKAWDWLSGLFD